MFFLFCSIFWFLVIFTNKETSGEFARNTLIFWSCSFATFDAAYFRPSLVRHRVMAKLCEF